jgi:polyhydroxybutyrate depolymerase
MKRAAFLIVLVASGLAAFGTSIPSASASTTTTTTTATPTTAGLGAVRGTGGLKTVNVRSGGLQRYYLLYVPNGDSAAHPLPLVLAYSGAGDSAADTAQSSGLLSVAQQRHNIIVAFPEGYDETWNDDAGNPPAEAAHVNDIAFSKKMVAGIESRYPVDLTRVVATGLSNGAILTELLGCRLAADLTLIVPVEGQMSPTFSRTCGPAMPISVYEIHGTGDQAIPYGGGTFSGVGGPVEVLSAPASVARWATVDACAKAKTSAKSGNTVLTKYKGCTDGVTVTLDSIRGGQHVWPSNFGGTLVGAITSLPSTRRAAGS